MLQFCFQPSVDKWSDLARPVSVRGSSLRRKPRYKNTLDRVFLATTGCEDKLLIPIMVASWPLAAVLRKPGNSSSVLTILFLVKVVKHPLDLGHTEVLCSLWGTDLSLIIKSVGLLTLQELRLQKIKKLRTSVKETLAQPRLEIANKRLNCEISSFHRGEFEVQNCLLGCTAV
jgi:hypothetical protein